MLISWKNYCYCKAAAVIFRGDTAFHVFYKSFGDGKSQSCGIPCVFHCVKSVKKLFGLDRGESFCGI